MEAFQLRLASDVPPWPSVSGEVPRLPDPMPRPSGNSGKDDLRARNRVAAKKWRDKKDEMLSNLESRNDQLRLEALRLRRQAMALQTENQVLEDELKFFQSFMTKIMNVTPKHGGPGNLPIPGGIFA
jgi:hypothetical protein